jgi:hypothetical protein
MSLEGLPAFQAMVLYRGRILKRHVSIISTTNLQWAWSVQYGKKPGKYESVKRRELSGCLKSSCSSTALARLDRAIHLQSSGKDGWPGLTGPKRPKF